MVIFRILGRLFFLAGIAALGWDLWRWLVDGETFRLMAVGELWFNIDSASLNGAQAAIQRYLWPVLWDPIIVTVLVWPAAITFAGFGLILMILFRRRRRTGRYS